MKREQTQLRATFLVWEHKRLPRRRTIESSTDIVRATLTINGVTNVNDEALGVTTSDIPNGADGNPVISVAGFDASTNQLVPDGGDNC